ncbi:cold-shock protein [Hasllibacter sp. MH4015]|uniref:cold-shock protein n=1 Tax=Hasllibacter sp. MH4015 TaxID=2854029 RepID=UPI001CD2A7FE|nr:cold shock protein [Hasllibacter sp. MH4015]
MADGVVSGQVKWFDAGKGFGFVIDDKGGPDILLHANVLRNFGRGSVAEGARVALRANPTQRGLQATEILSIDTPETPPGAQPEKSFDLPDTTRVPFEAARMKWFDKSKGFGFANVFGKSEDVFVHIEVLRASGFSELQPGEAVAIKVIDGPRGKMAAEIRVWDDIPV